ncbi:MAG: hypothetical protein OXI63_16195 [Candidatus Poribacteria bacterium]|nr:hypothetical protein [Candidatus Poribacteria bacterium]
MIAITISVLALIITAFPVWKYFKVERGRVDVYMSNFIHQPEDSIRTGDSSQLFGNTKFHATIHVKNIGGTPVKDLNYKIIETKSTLSEYNKIAIKQAYPVKYLEPNVERMIYIFNSRTSDEMMDIVITDKNRFESIYIEIEYKDIFGIRHTDTFRIPFYSSLYRPRTETQEISSWLRNIRDEMRGLSSNLGRVAREIKNLKENQEN